MIDLSTVKTLIIPEGKVKKIVRGSDTIWEDLSVSNAIVIYPATEEESSVIGEQTYLNNILNSSRELSLAEKYIFYVNNIAHVFSPSQTASAGSALTLTSDDDYVQIVTITDNYFEFFVQIRDELTSPVLVEMHYIPE